MLPIEYPNYNFRFKTEGNTRYIFDEVRKKWLVFLPEEWVRQNFIQYLIQIKNYPSSLIAVEKGIQLGELKKRCDIVVYKEAKPWMIVECKSSRINLSEKTIHQIFRYNITLQVPYLAITNGHQNYAVKLQDGRLHSLAELPDWEMG